MFVLLMVISILVLRLDLYTPSLGLDLPDLSALYVDSSGGAHDYDEVFQCSITLNTHTEMYKCSLKISGSHEIKTWRAMKTFRTNTLEQF